MSAALVRNAAHDGRLLATLRCYDLEGTTVVAAEVLPVGETEPVLRGPYRFATAPEAFRFVQETVLALQYLGCHVT